MGPQKGKKNLGQCTRQLTSSRRRLSTGPGRRLKSTSTTSSRSQNENTRLFHGRHANICIQQKDMLRDTNRQTWKIQPWIFWTFRNGHFSTLKHCSLSSRKHDK